MRFSEHRRQYTLGGLRRSDLAPEPVAQFILWQEQAISAELADPTACALATRQADGTLRQRMVLMKGVDERGLVFYTNYESNKAAALDAYEQASMLFPWNELDRQVSVTGSVARISDEESDAYFASRPRDSQLGAWTSPQSQVITSRSILEARLDQIKRKFADGEVPLPDNWGGYRIIPESFEFWQGRPSRLHDRFIYRLSGERQWTPGRLAP